MKETTDKQSDLSVEQKTKKEWITPEMTELNLNKVYTSGENALSGLSGT
jgi:hypothetical protein